MNVQRKVGTGTNPGLTAGFVSAALLFAVLPFNLALHVCPDFAYVDGAFVNYLDIIVHVVDVAVVLFIGWLMGMAVVNGGWKQFADRNIRVAFLGIVAVWLLYNVIFRDPIVLYVTSRMLLYGGVFLGLKVLSDRARFAEALPKEISPARKISETLLVTSLIVPALVQSAIAFLQFLYNRMLGLDWIGESIVQAGGYSASSVYLPGGAHVRGYGTFPHPNVLGGYLVMVYLVLIVRIEKAFLERRTKVGLVLIAAAVLVLVGIMVTWSRTAWLVAGVITATWVVHLLRKLAWRVKKSILAVILVVGTAGLLWFFFGSGTIRGAVYSRLIEQSSSSDISVTQRTELAGRAVDIFRENPVFGVGPGRFIIALSQDPVLTDSGIRLMQPVHNVFLLILAETGVVGIILLVYAIALCFRRIRWSWQSVAIVSSILIMCLLDHYLWTLPQGMLLWSILFLV
ncbi:MAG: O-antigen ligase family protein [Candidatus Dojkabacteria bacterium]|nr:O-antigen ligase family protein [Candidatus Dojkabacteria bacterium]